MTVTSPKSRKEEQSEQAMEEMQRCTDCPAFTNPISVVTPPFARDANNKLVRRGYWLDMNDRSLVMVMTQGIGSHLTNDEKRAHLNDLKRGHLIDQVCIQEILPPERPADQS